MTSPTPPRITIITPTLNQAPYLERTICSVLDQAWGDIEYIITDGGSTDGSIEIIRQYADDIAWWCSEPDDGPADAINRALAHATGDVVGILAGDDLYLPETLMHVGETFSRDDAPDWLVGHCVRIGSHDSEHGRVEAALPRDLSAYLMHDSGLLPLSGTFYHRRLLEAHGPFDADLHYAFGYEMNCRLLAEGHAPMIAARPLAAQRACHISRGIDQILQRGREYVDAAVRHSDQLPIGRRYALWRNCEQRRRIYALAEAEAHADAARRLLWQRLLHHPWWLADSRYRHALLHGTRHDRTPHSPMPAA